MIGSVYMSRLDVSELLLNTSNTFLYLNCKLRIDNSCSCIKEHHKTTDRKHCKLYCWINVDWNSKLSFQTNIYNSVSLLEPFMHGRRTTWDGKLTIHSHRYYTVRYDIYDTVPTIMYTLPWLNKRSTKVKMLLFKVLISLLE